MRPIPHSRCLALLLALLVPFAAGGSLVIDPIAMGPFPARDGQRANFIIRDNAGNLLQFIASR